MFGEKLTFETDPDNGMVIGPDDLHYETESEAMYFGVLNLCGCGQPELVHRFLIDCMEAKSDGSRIIDRDKVAALVEANTELVVEFILHFLDSKHLLDHGTSVNYPWPTELGLQFIQTGATDNRCGAVGGEK